VPYKRRKYDGILKQETCGIPCFNPFLTSILNCSLQLPSCCPTVWRIFYTLLVVFFVTGTRGTADTLNYISTIGMSGDFFVLSHEEDTKIRGVPRGPPSSSETQMSRLEVRHSLHWPAKGKERHCCVCQMKKLSEKTVYYCKECDGGLYVVPRFKLWHTNTQLGLTTCIQ
jgi:hypothetical protein